jgi:acylphosphatase
VSVTAKAAVPKLIDFEGKTTYFQFKGMEVGANIIVSGLVQGVGFRFFVHRHASRLGVRGFVRNLYSGDVEIEVEGDRSLIEELIKEVRVGPRAARVQDVQVKWEQHQQRYYDFGIR